MLGLGFEVWGLELRCQAFCSLFADARSVLSVLQGLGFRVLFSKKVEVGLPLNLISPNPKQRDLELALNPKPLDMHRTYKCLRGSRSGFL